MNTSWLPSRRVVAYIIIPLCTLFMLWVLGQHRQQQKQDSIERYENLEQVVGAVTDADSRRDSDGDLLKDWEEFLYQTDSNNPDTDGDGLNDYLEVLDPIRDPNTPDAELGRYQATTTEDIVSGTYYAIDPDLNATEKFSRDAFNLYSQLSQIDNPARFEETLINQVAETVDAREEKQGIYTREDLTIRPDSAETKNAYRKAYTRAVRPLNNLGEYDLLLLGLYSETSNAAHLQELLSNQDIYNQFVSNLVDTIVPSEIADVHLELVNNFYLLGQDVATMATADVDPLGAMAAAGDYVIDEESIELNLQALSLYLQDK